MGGMVLGGGGAAAAAAVGGDDAVVMQLAAAAGEESVITVNCPDQAGLGCDICHTILEFGLRITRGGTRSTSPDLLSLSLASSISRSPWNSLYPHARLPCLRFGIRGVA